MKTRDGSPQPRNQIDTLKNVGYNFNSAVADILDNSISAKSRNVRVKFLDKDIKNVAVEITDDGFGMTHEELAENMIIACKDSSFEREKNDLGRFGSGMKMASFSQCNKLTVVSKKEGHQVAAFSWDLEKIKETNQWLLNELEEEDIKSLKHLNEDLLTSSGTQVIWENLDPWKTDYDEEKQKFIQDASNELKNYLALHFHKFLEARGKNRLSIKVQGENLKPLNPFFEGWDGHQCDHTEDLTVRGGKIECTVHTIPHHSRIPTNKFNQEQIDELYKRSGIYIYRSNRLIIASGWMGIARPGKLADLGRLEIHIPPTLDADWKLDVQKSEVQIDPKTKQKLKRIVSLSIKGSSEEHVYTGKKTSINDYWEINKNRRKGFVYYEIKASNKEFLKMAKTIKRENVPLVKNYLKNLQVNLPIPHIFTQSANKPKSIDQKNSEILIDAETEKKLDKIWSN